jgi:hypothetical protein
MPSWDGSFGPKTVWIAVRDRSPDQVADALRLSEREPMPWGEGVLRAHRDGVFVCPDAGGWTLALGHGMPWSSYFPAEPTAFCAWLRELSSVLGEVQFFSTHRVPDTHQWARATDGEIIRAYMFGDNWVRLFIGDPTTGELELGVGLRPQPDGVESWTDEEWANFYETTPCEYHVWELAGKWSIDPMTTTPDMGSSPGIWGGIQVPT